MEKIKPVGARCLVEVYKPAEKSASGILLDNSSNSSAAPVRGTVVDSGSDSKFKKGDVIFYRRYSVDELKVITEKGEEVIYFVDDQDILGYVEVEAKT